MDCRYSRFTGVFWAPRINCTIVQCRSPEAQEDASSKKWKHFAGFDGVRFAVDKDFKIIESADYLEVRSRFCNEKCPYYKQ